MDKQEQDHLHSGMHQQKYGLRDTLNLNLSVTVTNYQYK